MLTLFLFQGLLKLNLFLGRSLSVRVCRQFRLGLGGYGHRLNFTLRLGVNAVAIRLQGVMVPGIGQIPVQAIQALPYLMTVILLAGFIGKAIPPKASGLPYVKER